MHGEFANYNRHRHTSNTREQIFEKIREIYLLRYKILITIVIQR